MTILWLLAGGGLFVLVSFVVYAINRRSGTETLPEVSRERMTIEAEITTRNNSP